MDTNCIVASICMWHEHHVRSVQELEWRLDRGQELVVAGSCLVEAFAVLTRLPPPHRLTAESAATLLVANFASSGLELIALQAQNHVELLRTAPERGVVGGAIYDAVILACAVAAGVDDLLTFNDRHFRRMATQGIEIVVPGR